MVKFNIRTFDAATLMANNNININELMPLLDMSNATSRY